MVSHPSKNRMFEIAVKNHAEEVLKVFYSSLILVDIFTLFQIFCPGLYIQQALKVVFKYALAQVARVKS